MRKPAKRAHRRNRRLSGSESWHRLRPPTSATLLPPPIWTVILLRRAVTEVLERPSSRPAHRYFLVTIEIFRRLGRIRAPSPEIDYSQRRAMDSWPRHPRQPMPLALACTATRPWPARAPLRSTAAISRRRPWHGSSEYFKKSSRSSTAFSDFSEKLARARPSGHAARGLSGARPIARGPRPVDPSAAVGRRRSRHPRSRRSGAAISRSRAGCGTRSVTRCRG